MSGLAEYLKTELKAKNATKRGAFIAKKAPDFADMLAKVAHTAWKDSDVCEDFILEVSRPVDDRQLYDLIRAYYSEQGFTLSSESVGNYIDLNLPEGREGSLLIHISNYTDCLSRLDRRIILTAEWMK